MNKHQLATSEVEKDDIFEKFFFEGSFYKKVQLLSSLLHFLQQALMTYVKKMYTMNA